MNGWLGDPGPGPDPPPVPPVQLRLVHACKHLQVTPEAGELELSFIPETPTFSFGLSFPTTVARERCVLLFRFSTSQQLEIDFGPWISTTSISLSSSVVYVPMNEEAGNCFLSLTMFENEHPLTVIRPIAKGEVLPSIVRVVLQGSDLGSLPLQFNWCYSAFT
jgi:hypothetical protein